MPSTLPTASSAELRPFMVSAPGKVIVFGEHAVVYGKGAMAASLSLRCYLLVTPLPKEARMVTLQFPDIGLDHSWNIDELPWDLFSATDKNATVHKLNAEFSASLQPLIAHLPEKVKTAATAFLYMYLSLESKNAPAAVYTMRSTIPIGAGLGSSATISVCLSTAFQLQTGQLVRPSIGMLEHDSRLQLKRINNWAFVGEMCLHGNPSGVDNTVATGGKAVFFQRRAHPLPPTVTHINNFPELPLLLVNTKHPRRTADEVAKVKALRDAQALITNSMLDTIDQITAEALRTITEADFSAAPGSPGLARLGELIRVNHGLLVSLGVSHPKLEHVRELIDYTGIGWTKLTGAGGGGCSITLLKPSANPEVLKDLSAKIEAAGFQEYETTLGGPGVGVLWPAVIKEDGGKREITAKDFLEAKDVAAVETLVGVKHTEEGNGWEFWVGGVPESE